MVIENAQYIKGVATNTNEVIKCSIDGVTVSVPLDPANRHYQAIQEWVAEGNTIEDAD